MHAGSGVARFAEEGTFYCSVCSKYARILSGTHFIFVIKVNSSKLSVISLR